MDPDKGSGQYHRSIVGNLELQTDAVFSGAATPGGTGTTAGGTGTTSGGTAGGSAGPSNGAVSGGSAGPSSGAASGATSSGGTASSGAASGATSSGGSGDGGTVVIGGAASPAPSPAPSAGQGPTAPQAPAVVSTDLVAPTLVMTGSTAAGTVPDASGAVDRWAGSFDVSEGGTIDAVVTTPGGAQVRHFSVPSKAGAASVIWDWRTDAGAPAGDGQYVISVAARDVAGNASPVVHVSVSVFRTLSKVFASRALFYPQDGDLYAPSTRLSFQLAVPAAVTWTIADASGHVVLTRYQNTPMAARSVAWIWTGLDQSGLAVPVGRYFATVTAARGTFRASATTPLTAGAFAITTSPTAAVAGQNLTITALSAEPLSGSPRLTISQSGATARTMVMTRIGPNTWRVTIRLATVGRGGSVGLEVVGTDARGGSNVATTGVSLK